ncbi:Stk1 family PASTA domain-containing Ser/Thr kinase [Pengzhenrongella frigida]|uniref:non-specific serine/threonine protein kinase n=1 Tax=Pengzhenrongella frigida TaxID=1259133 RepID=A0A4Q5MXI0_9MICO|nr:Stk1 family PASTA domain-containing Ser/Thr kinase [Cellulomonas sp. HLT2-17]RYV50326.1 Stk1 family PASTA domain-containing Ser/Thr kinase [Cellulomonas sp. HLT2-17]
MGATITDPLVGRLVDGRYEVVSRIARGGMATVYLAVDRRLDREVALKVMHPHLAEGTAGAAFIARFRREARAAARLTHPALVGVLDQGVDGETSYLTMEYVDGVNLRRHLGERGALTVAESFTILERVLDGLAAAHRTGLVHRDIKPENVLLATDGRIKLADFGLARAVTEVTSTTTGTVFGTVAYLAPELVAMGVCDARTDIYSAGILLYEMITGRQPYTGETPIQVAYLHVNSDIPVPSDLVHWLPPEIDGLVSALAAREPENRPVDAAAALDLVRRTHALLDDETLARHADIPPSFVLPTATEAPDDDGAPAESSGSGPLASDPDAGATARLDVASSGGTIALAIGTGVRTPAQIVAEERAATAPARRRRNLRVAAITLLVAALLAAGTWWFVKIGPGAFTAVPDVIGTQQESAESVLTLAGLDTTAVSVFDTAVPGVVVSTDPGADARIRKDGSVELRVSQGPEMTTVPEGLVGMSFDDASAALVAARFTVGDSITPYDDVAAVGSVMAVSAEPNASLEVGTEIVLTVSQGRAPLTIISVIGATQEQATKDLEGLGLAVAAVPAFSDTVDAGRVIDQDPKQGVAGHRLDTVTITVSQGPEMIEVPDVYGQNSKKASEAITAAGFKVEVRNPQGFSPLNIVYSQTPAGGAGKTAPKGSTIVINVF